MTCLNQKICRKKPPFVDRTDVSDVNPTDRLHRQLTFYLTHFEAGGASPGEAQPGSTLFTHWATWCVVLSTGHGRCCSQGPWDMYPLGHPGGKSQHYNFEWRTSVFSHAPHLCMPPCPSSHVLWLGFCVYLYMLIQIGVGAQCCYS